MCASGLSARAPLSVSAPHHSIFSSLWCCRVPQLKTFEMPPLLSSEVWRESSSVGRGIVRADRPASLAPAATNLSRCLSEVARAPLGFRGSPQRLELALQVVELLVRQIFHVHELGSCLFDRSYQLVQFELDHL